MPLSVFYNIIAMVHVVAAVSTPSSFHLWPFENFACQSVTLSWVCYTVKPVLSGHRIKWTPSIKRTVAEVPKFISFIFCK